MKFKKVIESLKNWEEERTKREKILLIIMTALLPLFLFYKFYYQPTKDTIHKYKEEIQQLNLEIAKLENFAKKEKELELLLRERKKFLEEIKETLPTEKEVPKLLKNISLMTKQTQLDILNFTPKNEEKRNYYVAIPFEIVVKGNFPNIIKYLNQVESLPRLITLESIEFLPQEKEEKLMAKCLFVTYKYTGEPIEDKKSK